MVEGGGQAGKTAVLKVASYNIHQGVGTDGRKDLARVAEVIVGMDADVVALQEVHVRFGGVEESHQLDFLAEATGMHSVSGATMLRPDGHYGNAVLVRTPIIGQNLHDLSFPAREPRGIVDLLLDTPIGTVRMLATHLGLRPAERRYQVKRLLVMIEASKEPVVLAGDFNEWFPWGRPSRWLGGGFSSERSPKTFPARCPLFALDRIFTGMPLQKRTLQAVGEPLARVASDHRPLLAEIENPSAEPGR